MNQSLTDVPGFKVGHAGIDEAATGCTVILCPPEGAAAGVDIRGGAPGVRETGALSPVNAIEGVHAILLSGGSAFGLDAAGGIMQYLEERGIGFDTGAARVPIVPGAVIFDLAAGRGDLRPDKALGYRACQNASSSEASRGNVGAGTGATLGKALGAEFSMKGGLGTASLKIGELVIGALVVVNSLGDVIDPSTGQILAGTLNKAKTGFANSAKLMESLAFTGIEVFGGTNTTIACLATNGQFNKTQCTKLAMMAHDGLARAINPIHTMFDGDTIFALASGEVRADLTAVGSLGAGVLAQAVVNAVKAAESAYGFTAWKDLAGGREKSGA
ncbi:MAG: P1 family peptidase [Spirochaetales bacterium]|jgi:L-aminopeptidase/D-esterase-like protein|nr:P1 family peptidase [Spirochaetales bacterium]